MTTSWDEDTKDDLLEPPRRGTVALCRSVMHVFNECERRRTAAQAGNAVEAQQAAQEATYQWLVGVATLARLETRGNRDPWLDAARRAAARASKRLGQELRTSARWLKAEHRPLLRLLRLTFAVIRAPAGKRIKRLRTQEPSNTTEWRNETVMTQIVTARVRGGQLVLDETKTSLELLEALVEGESIDLVPVDALLLGGRAFTDEPTQPVPTRKDASR